jgi:parallel beta-helix repeat protein
VGQHANEPFDPCFPCGRVSPPHHRRPAGLGTPARRLGRRAGLQAARTNNEFKSPGTGVTGHGTSSSPYIIEGWEFTPNSSAGAGGPAILITGTSAHFVIRNCRFDMGAGNVGVRFEDMSNGVVSDSSFLGNDVAIEVTRSGALTLQQNRIEASGRAGMVLVETGTTQVKKNTFTGNALDIQLNTTEKGEIVENKFTSKGTAVDFSEGALFKMNTNTFTGAGGAIGARIDGMDAGEIKDNKFEGFTKYGLQMLRSNRGTVQNNEFVNNGLMGGGAGVSVEESSSMQLTANKANNNKGRGVYLVQTSQSWIKDGEANGNGNDGIELRLSSNDGIRNMKVHDNARSGVNLNESGNNLVESNTVLRNKVADNGSIIVGGNTNKIVRNEVAFSGGFGILITQWMSGNQILANNMHDNKRDDFYSDSDPNANIVSDEEIVPEDEEGPARRGLPVPPP